MASGSLESFWAQRVLAVVDVPADVEGRWT